MEYDDRISLLFSIIKGNRLMLTIILSEISRL
jgi:hypothetical protein